MGVYIVVIAFYTNLPQNIPVRSRVCAFYAFALNSGKEWGVSWAFKSFVLRFNFLNLAVKVWFCSVSLLNVIVSQRSYVCYPCLAFIIFWIECLPLSTCFASGSGWIINSTSFASYARIGDWIAIRGRIRAFNTIVAFFSILVPILTSFTF